MSKMIFAAAAVATLLAGQALAADKAESKSAQIPAAGVNFYSRAEVQDFYARITVAAKDVCRIDSKNKYVAESDTICVERAVADAVKSADRPLLTAVYQNASTTSVASNR